LDAVDMGVPSLSLEVLAVPGSVATAAARVGEFAAANGAGPHVVAAISLAIGDAVTGVSHEEGIEHPGVVRVMADVEEGELEFVVSDGGRGAEVWMRFPLGG
jgi:hypothetical protein